MDSNVDRKPKSYKTSAPIPIPRVRANRCPCLEELKKRQDGWICELKKWNGITVNIDIDLAGDLSQGISKT